MDLDWSFDPPNGGGEWVFLGRGPAADGCTLLLVKRVGSSAYGLPLRWCVMHVESDGTQENAKFYRTFDEAMDHMEAGMAVL